MLASGRAKIGVDDLLVHYGFGALEACALLSAQPTEDRLRLVEAQAWGTEVRNIMRSATKTGNQKQVLIALIDMAQAHDQVRPGTPQRYHSGQTAKACGIDEQTADSCLDALAKNGGLFRKTSHTVLGGGGWETVVELEWAVTGTIERLQRAAMFDPGRKQWGGRPASPPVATARCTEHVAMVQACANCRRLKRAERSRQRPWQVHDVRSHETQSQVDIQSSTNGTLIERWEEPQSSERDPYVITARQLDSGQHDIAHAELASREDWEGHDVRTCRKCIEQMFGGPRCHLGNPTAEERAASERHRSARRQRDGTALSKSPKAW